MKRRNFLQSSATIVAGAGFASILPLDLMAKRRVAPSDRINIAAIGINGMGWTDLNALLKIPEVNCLALCDVDKNVLDRRTAELAKNNIRVSSVGDYRKILDNRDVDAVLIATPDHWHCLIMTEACSAGKDVYVEKPCGSSIAESNAMVASQQKHSRVVQVGQWQRSEKHFRDAIAFVHSGKLGQIRLAKAWAYQGWMHSIPVRPDSPVPAGVDYNLWLGPAKHRPFNPNRFHFNFRWFWDYAGGLMTDWGVHLIDYALLGMDAGVPKSIMAAGGKFAYPDDAAETPDTLTTVFEYDGFNIQWEHATGINDGPYSRDHGIAFIGNNGTLVLDRGGWEVIPEIDNGVDKMEAVTRQKVVDNGIELNTKNFIDVVKSRNLGDLKVPIQDAAKVAGICDMGNIALRTGKKLFWDAGEGKFTDAAANQLLAAAYHNGYQLPKS